MRLLDIYKKTPIIIESEEHILLNSLGGRLVRRDLIDKATNDTFGSTIDAAVADSLRVIRVLLNAESGDGGPPPAVMNATAADGEAYNILPGGIPALARPEVQFDETEDGSVTLRVRARSMKEARKLTRQSAEAHLCLLSETFASSPR